MREIPQRLAVGEARWPQDRALVEGLFREYIDGLGVDIAFQNVRRELATLPGRYALPHGCVLIARAGRDPIGVAAYRRYRLKVCEMKRLYVRPPFRGLGVARELVEGLIAEARDSGYRSMVLDTLAPMQAARALYAELGFRPIPPFNRNPLPDVIYLGRAL